MKRTHAIRDLSAVLRTSGLAATFVAVALLAVLLAVPAAAETKRIDRSGGGSTAFAVTFSVSDERQGHAFVTWNREDETQRMTTNEVVGFYPLSDGPGGGGKSKNPVEMFVLLIGVDGELQDDARRKATHRLIVHVSEDAWREAKRVHEKWEAGRKYRLLASDCVTYAREVAEALGLLLPARLAHPFPVEHVRQLMVLND